MISKNVLLFGRGLVLAVVVAAFAGCAASPFAGYAGADEEDEKRVAAGEFVEAAAAQIVIAQHPDINGGNLSPKAVTKIQQLNISCQKQVQPQLAGAGQQAVTGGVGYGVTGGLGTAGGAAAASFPNPWGVYFPYGAVAHAAAGAYNSAMGGGFAVASAVGSCTREFWQQTARTDPDFAGAVVLPAYYGKRWGGSVPPALDKDAVASKPQPQPSPAR